MNRFLALVLLANLVFAHLPPTPASLRRSAAHKKRLDGHFLPSAVTLHRRLPDILKLDDKVEILSLSPDGVVSAVVNGVTTTFPADPPPSSDASSPSESPTPTPPSPSSSLDTPPPSESLPPSSEPSPPPPVTEPPPSSSDPAPPSSTPEPTPPSSDPAPPSSTPEPASSSDPVISTSQDCGILGLGLLCPSPPSQTPPSTEVPPSPSTSEPPRTSDPQASQPPSTANTPPPTTTEDPVGSETQHPPPTTTVGLCIGIGCPSPSTPVSSDYFPTLLPPVSSDSVPSQPPPVSSGPSPTILPPVSSDSVPTRPPPASSETQHPPPSTTVDLCIGIDCPPPSTPVSSDHFPTQSPPVSSDSVPSQPSPVSSGSFPIILSPVSSDAFSTRPPPVSSGSLPTILPPLSSNSVSTRPPPVSSDPSPTILPPLSSDFVSTRPPTVSSGSLPTLLPTVSSDSVSSWPPPVSSLPTLLPSVSSDPVSTQQPSPSTTDVSTRLPPVSSEPPLSTQPLSTTGDSLLSDSSVSIPSTVVVFPSQISDFSSSSTPDSLLITSTPTSTPTPTNTQFEWLTHTSLIFSSISESASDSLSLTDPDQVPTATSFSTADTPSVAPSIAPLPSGLPARIIPGAGGVNPEVDDLDGFTMIAILFDRGLPWDFVAHSTDSPGQIFKLLVVSLYTALGINSDQVKIFALQVWIPNSYKGPSDRSELGTTWLGYIPTGDVEVLAAQIKAKNSKLYTALPSPYLDLASHINPSFDIMTVTATTGIPGSGGSNNGSSGGAPDDSRTRENAIIGVVSALGGITLIVLGYLIYRAVQKRRELAHRRLSDPPTNPFIGEAPPNRDFDQDSIGGQRRRSFYFAEDSLRGFSDHTNDGVRLSPEQASGLNRRPIAGNIGPPVMRENSLNF